MRYLVLLLLLAAISTNAFVLPASPRASEFALFLGRREFFSGALVAVVGATSAAAPAQATYSAYTHREQDWEQRKSSGEVRYSSARDLRKQLQEIVPQNSESSKMFCPNGPSSNVSPLMENKCGDALAIPSVFGRSNDVLGNSIPGVAGRYSAATVSGTSISANVGGFPSYK
eukprot:CAMPEP_0116578728 /NCGR_PEP_ID=MMETSP0397-20121206/21868_1 /TAXON_ID=216820 /ORGANISM="Cyclophora tenuis, Strain ECT3854" /LENGTH=171 /DNA_ID=CAMNT_0004108151 /DNA_START=686 /DNA_END=1201 /DNA_ORIENTATION=+